MIPPEQKNNNNDVVEDITYRKLAFKKFTDIFMKQFGSESGSFDAYEMKKESSPYKTEIAIIQKLSAEGVLWGIAASIASFAFLRKAPIYLSRYMMRKQQKVPFMPQPPPSASSFYRQQAAETGQQQQKDIPLPPNISSGGFIWRTMWLFIDVGLSVWCGSMFSLVMTDTKKCLEGVAEIPLVEGRSILAEELCTDFIKEHQRFPSQLWSYTNDHKDEEDLDLWLHSIHTFVQNCKKRQAYENALRKELTYDLSGRKGADKFPIIPPPGVPIDYSTDENDESNNDDVSITSDEMNNFLDDFPEQSDFSDSNDDNLTSWKTE